MVALFPATDELGKQRNHGWLRYPRRQFSLFPNIARGVNNTLFICLRRRAIRHTPFQKMQTTRRLTLNALI